MKVIHIITGLNDGGAEHSLFRLCSSTTKDELLVVSLQGPGKYGPLLALNGIKVFSLGITYGPSLLIGAVRLIVLIYRYKPDLLHTWMYHADLLGTFAYWFTPVRNIVWCIRASHLDPDLTNMFTRLIIKALAFLSWRNPVAIVSCAQKSIKLHIGYGYCPSKFVYIPNGFELSSHVELAHPPLSLSSVKASNYSIHFGMVARYHPQKDHETLIKAFSLIKNKSLPFKLTLVGTDVDRHNIHLLELIHDCDLENHISLLGPRTNICELMSGFDIHVLSSAYGEAFPNVVAEAMLNCTPCIVTDVGDSAFIVGDTGWVVAPSNPYALANAIYTAAMEFQNAEKWLERRITSRHRILNNFSLASMCEEYSSLWASCLL